MIRRLLISILVFLAAVTATSGAPKGYLVEGCVLEAKTQAPVVGAAVRLGEDYLWAITDIDGNFTFENVQPGKYTLEASCLGYVSISTEIDVKQDVIRLTLKLYENSLALDEVVVTAEKAKDGLGTTQNIGRDALNHLQLSNTTDIAALLPGGKTVNPDLTAANSFSLREGGAANGNASFGTAVEVDGVRLGNNASFGEMSGKDTRSVAVENIESIEVITGVPSAEYGDLNSGMVKINTRKGRTPVNITFAVNPRTYQASVSKGIDLQDNNGVLNLSAEWARAVKKLISPYESYNRTGITLNYTNTFARALHFEAGFAGNIGGMDTKDDPDAFTGQFKKERDNAFRANTALNWMINKPWATSLRFDASVNFNDNLYRFHKYESHASNQPAVHAEVPGYFMAEQLPLTYFSDQVTDSKELDFAASLKYNWHTFPQMALILLQT